MHLQHCLPASLLSLVSLAAAAPNAALQPLDVDVAPRALPDSPSRGYAPATVDCPSTRPVIRSAARLSPQEADWLRTRRANTVQPLKDFLGASSIADFDAPAYVEKHRQNLTALPNVGIAVSGGGYRAMMNGAGFVAAADARTPGATDKGGIGGLLQSSTYLAGLSGGGWLVGSIYSNNFSTVTNLRDGSKGSSVWKLDRSILQGPKEKGISIVNTASYWDDVFTAVETKADAHYDTSITDYWGRTLSYQLINATDGGPAYTFSSLSRQADFDKADRPLPILVADGRRPGEKVISLSSTVYEFNPWEMGSFDPTVFGFVPLEYLGSNFSNGSLPRDERCVRGFDQFGFVMGTSSSLFNQLLLNNMTEYGVPGFLVDAVTAVAERIGRSDNDIAQYAPNPFFGWNPRTNDNAEEHQLTLVDGGEDLQNIPLHPLIQPERALDVIFAVDSSADVNNWPNGTALRATYDRVKETISNGTQFPAVPDAETFINKGLNRRPTFFGCNADNFTASANPTPPLIVYVPNAPYTAWGNVSTFTMSYEDAERDAIIENGYNVATRANGTANENAGDTAWRTCVGCAVLQRSLLKTKTPVPPACQRCFDAYCWDGSLDSRPVAGDGYSPEPYLEIKDSAAGRGLFGGHSGLAAAAAAAASALLSVSF